MGNNLVLRPSYWASVSGGKDSFYMLNIILHNPDRYPLDGVVHFELEYDYPFIKEVVKYMETECKKHNIKFVRIKPTHTWQELYEKYGYPTGRVRWCNANYKLSAKRELERFLKGQGCYLIQYIGYCYDEVNRYQKNRSKNNVYPLVDLEITESYILNWARNLDIYNNYYKYNRRCGCMYCPLSSMLETAYLMKYYPAEYEILFNLAKETEKKVSEKTGKKFSIFSSNAKYDVEYRDQKVKKCYLQKLDDANRKLW